jgi:hypothetical protein
VTGPYVPFEQWVVGAFTRLQTDVAAIKTAVGTTIPARFIQLERFVMATEAESREQLSAAITGALGAYDQVVAERDRYKAELEQADETRAQAVADALEAESVEDASFNESKVEELRRLQPTVTEPPAEPTEPTA